jgi:hypothetical protein
VRWTAAVLGGLTAAELAWFLVYVTAEEARPWIWLVPLMAAATTGVILGRLGRVDMGTRQHSTEVAGWRR